MGYSGPQSQEPWQDMSPEKPCRQLVPNGENVPEKDRGQGSSSQHNADPNLFRADAAPCAESPALAKSSTSTGCWMSELAEKNTTKSLLLFPPLSFPPPWPGSSHLWASSERPLWGGTNRKTSPDNWKDAGVQSRTSLWGMRKSACPCTQVHARKKNMFCNKHKCRKALGSITESKSLFCYCIQQNKLLTTLIKMKHKYSKLGNWKEI